KSMLAWDLKYRTSEKDKKIIENKLQISQQQNDLKKKDVLLGSISGGILLLMALLIILFYIHKLSNNKHKFQIQQLFLRQQQQEIEQLKAIMKGEEQERERIARELHDGIGGMLAAINMNLSAMSERQGSLNDKSQLNKVLNM